MQFKYHGIDIDGCAATGKVDAASLEEATHMLAARNIDSTALTPVTTKSRLRLLHPITRSDIAIFCERLADLTATDLPLDKSLAALSHDVSNPGFAAAIARLSQGVEQGNDLETLLEEEQAFPPLMSALVQAGHKSGNLPAMLRLAATHSWHMQNLREQVIAAATYPVMIVMLMLTIFSGIMLQVVPRFQDLFLDMGLDLPTGTIFMFILAKHAPALIVILAGLLVTCLIFLWLPNPIEPIFRIKRWMLWHLPLIGSVMHAAYLHRFCRLLHLLLTTSMTLPQALELMARLDGKSLCPATAGNMARATLNGSSLAASMREQGKVFPRMLTWSLEACEDDGRLPDALKEMAELYERELQRHMVLLNTVLAPICVILAGGFVILAADALFAPLLQMLNVLSN